MRKKDVGKQTKKVQGNSTPVIRASADFDVPTRVSEYQTDHEEPTWQDSMYEEEESESALYAFEQKTSKRQCPTSSSEREGSKRSSASDDLAT